ncbi:MAG: alpha-glucan family phosphorylase [Victivallaceae bacterium]
MINVQLYNVAPQIPDDLKFLEQLSYNMWWCWHPDAIELFVRINPNLWRNVKGNTRRFLSMIPQSRLEELAADKGYLRQLKRVQADFERQVPEDDDLLKRRVAYFSLEFGIHESIRLYSGGLGVLAGDHLKAASDLKLPIVAVGLLYRQGYFKQLLDRNGWQIERYPENEIHNMPLKKACDRDGKELLISVKLKDRELFATAWKLQIGNITLLLLDTEIAQNPPEFRELTWRLYSGDRKMRLEQELLLGIGGFKALAQMGYDPAVCHMNEGHAAFLSLARIAHLVNDKGYDPDTALEIVWRTNIFTTHTPVPAGNEAFNVDLVRPYLEALKAETKLDVDRVINWGIPINSRNQTNEMSMTVMGLRMANYSNGVSRLHGEVARKMWQQLWPGRSVDEIPIKHITNGVHIASWVAQRKRIIYDRYLTLEWPDNPDKNQLRETVDNLPDEELWMAHELCRHSLIRKARKLMQNHIKCLNLPADVYQKNLLDPDILTIGFARRFATYKRGNLLLRNPERLMALLSDKERPIQLIFAGKAHPADEAGKALIQQLVQFSENHNVRGRLVFIEDYDISLARTMVQGVDVWLNTPRRPQEASGTSGMKAAANGVLNCSILDGWWDEAYTPDCGWAIIGDDNYEDPEDCDNFESNALFNLLEKDIIPCFYERSEGDLPLRWIKKMKGAITMALGDFSSMRMVQEYNQMFYETAVNSYDALMKDDAALAHNLVQQKARFIDNFSKISIDNPVVDGDLKNIHVGDTFNVTTKVFLNGLNPDEVEVQAYYGQVNPHNEIVHSQTLVMTMAEDQGNGHYIYKSSLKCATSGRFGLTARITPVGNNWRNSVPGFLCWPKNVV